MCAATGLGEAAAPRFLHAHRRLRCARLLPALRPLSSDGHATACLACCRAAACPPDLCEFVPQIEQGAVPQHPIVLHQVQHVSRHNCGVQLYKVLHQWAASRAPSCLLRVHRARGRRRWQARSEVRVGCLCCCTGSPDHKCVTIIVHVRASMVAQDTGLLGDAHLLVAVLERLRWQHGDGDAGVLTAGERCRRVLLP